jgi:hypothetical protein
VKKPVRACIGTGGRKEEEGGATRCPLAVGGVVREVEARPPGNALLVRGEPEVDGSWYAHEESSLDGRGESAPPAVANTATGVAASLQWPCTSALNLNQSIFVSSADAVCK